MTACLFADLRVCMVVMSSHMKVRQLFFLQSSSSGRRGVGLAVLGAASRVCAGERRHQLVRANHSPSWHAASTTSRCSSKFFETGSWTTRERRRRISSPIGAGLATRTSDTHSLLSFLTLLVSSSLPHRRHGHVLSVCCAGLRSPDANFNTVFPRRLNDETIQLHRGHSREPQDCRHCRPDQPAHSSGDCRPCF